MSAAGRPTDWVSLLDGVRVSREWMTRHTPELLDAWREVPTAEHRRRIAVHIIQAAARQSRVPDDDPGASVDNSLRAIVQRIDPRLVRGPDWLPLAAALARAATAGYDVERRLPALAAAGLPAWHPGRELHWRLLEDCPAALPAALPTAEDNRSGDQQEHTSPDRPQKSDTSPAGPTAATPFPTNTPARSKGASR